MSQIEVVIQPKDKDLGDDFFVRRSLPHPKKPMVGPFIFWDHMGPAQLVGENALKVRAHPHIGLATLTYLFSGEIMHRDSLSNEQAIRPGEVNWMTAGRGIVHSERAGSESDPLNLEGIQLWIALPKDQEDREPSFVHIKEKELPIIEEGGLWLRLIAGKFKGHESTVPVYSPLCYLNGKGGQGARFEHKLGENEEAALYIAKGAVEMEEASYEAYKLIVFKKGAQINFTIKSDETEFMFFGGDAFPEKRHIWWNLVSSSQEKIEKAKLDWKNGKFAKVINETEFIPLPED